MPTRLRQPTLTTIVLDPRRADSLQRQVYHRVRELIESKRVRSGARLPSTRMLASELRVSRNTVLAAFERLTAEGYIEARRGAGSYVADVLPDQLLCVQGTFGPADAVPSTDRRAVVDRAASLPKRAPVAPSHSPRPFMMTAPDLDAFPYRVWERLLTGAWREASHRILSHTDPLGVAELRDAVASYLLSARGVRCSADQVIIVPGSQQALDLAARVLLRPGDRAWVENPGYPGAHRVFTAAGAALVAVPVDSSGLDIGRGMAVEPNPRLVYVTPANQFPLGCTLSAERRAELVRLARTTGAFIVEDDYDAAFRHVGRPLPALQSMNEQVVYVGSFSRVISPSFGLGYVVVPRPLLYKFGAMHELAGARAGTLEQLVLARFIDEGYFAAHLRHLRSRCAERQGALVDAIAREIGGLLRVSAVDVGTHVVADLAPDCCAAIHDQPGARELNDVILAAEARRAGVASVALSTFYVGQPTRQGLVLGFAGHRPARLRRSVRELAGVIRGLHPTMGRLRVSA